jgi:hypothetical protein
MASVDRGYACKLEQNTQPVKFGQLVAFQKSYTKSRGNGWVMQGHEHRVGYVVGVRTIGTEGMWDSEDDEVWGRMTNIRYYVVTKSESVYLVATSMGRMYRVRKCDIHIFNGEGLEEDNGTV